MDRHRETLLREIKPAETVHVARRLLQLARSKDPVIALTAIQVLTEVLFDATYEEEGNDA